MRRSSPGATLLPDDHLEAFRNAVAAHFGRRAVRQSNAHIDPARLAIVEHPDAAARVLAAAGPARELRGDLRVARLLLGLQCVFDLRAQLRANRRAGSGQTTRGRVWVLDDGKPRGIDVRVGLSDGTMTEVSGDSITEGLEVIVGQQGGTAAPAQKGAPPRMFF